MALPPLRLGPGGLQVFAVEDTTAQITWSELGLGPVQFVPSAGPTVGVEADGGPGSILLTGLPAGRTLSVDVQGAALRRPVTLTATTLPAPAGPTLSRVATIGDVHVGATAFGHMRSVIERPTPAVLHPERCTIAALAEAVAWGAELIVVKGDLTDAGWAFQWHRAAALLADLPVPVVVLAGNHDRSGRRTIEPAAAGERHGLHVVDDVDHVDLPGLRVVLVDTAISGQSFGRVHNRSDRVAELAGSAPGSVLVALHHHLQRIPVTAIWPPGVPADQSRRFLDALAEANPRAIVTSGHTHRHRRRTHGPITVSQVGSTKDWPGVWGGYVADDGGLRQVVRRIGQPDVLRWTDYTRRGAAGMWRWWSPGAIEDRCFTLRWDGSPANS